MHFNVDIQKHRFPLKILNTSTIAGDTIFYEKKPNKSWKTSSKSSSVEEMHVCMWLRSKFTTCSILLPAIL